jgi:hypothetical protein
MFVSTKPLRGRGAACRDREFAGMVWFVAAGRLLLGCFLFFEGTGVGAGTGVEVPPVGALSEPRSATELLMAAKPEDVVCCSVADAAAAAAADDLLLERLVLGEAWFASDSRSKSLSSA